MKQRMFISKMNKKVCRDGIHLNVKKKKEKSHCSNKNQQILNVLMN